MTSSKMGDPGLDMPLQQLYDHRINKVNITNFVQTDFVNATHYMHG
jgi:hypothetical protein